MDNKDKIIVELKKLLEKSVRKRIPKEKFGLLLSGGLDSSLLALLLKKLNYNFICYTAEFSHPSLKKADDIKYIKLLEKELDLKVKIVKVSLKDVETNLERVIKIIKNYEVPMVSIALPIYFCLKQASSDNLKTVLYDCACDCIFAGLQKHKVSKNLKKACIQSLKNTYKKDFPRDTAIAKHFGINLKSPFLDKDLINFALSIPTKYKIKDNTEKYILRETALNLGLSKSIAFRKKKAIQYSSNSQKTLKKLVRKKGFAKIKDYLESLEMEKFT
ncbi:MAG: asparagine synthase C-terminal domain-containing protein [Candidatus Nanoarchaeia archaeon]